VTQPPPPARLLVVQTSYLGDLVLATPVFAALKQHWPSAQVAVLARPEVAPILRGHPDVDALVTDDKRGRNGGFAGFLRLVRELRARRFDLGVALHRGARTAVLLALAEIPLRVGFRQSELHLLYHRRVVRNPGRHDVERQLSILEPLGVPYDPARARPRLGVAREARRAVDEQLAAHGVVAESDYVVLAPGSAWQSKQWMPDRYAEVARALLARGEAVVYVGAPGEVATVEEVRRLAGGGVSLAGKTDTGGLAAVVARACAVVCNDSAPMHIAQAFQVPVVVIVGPTSAAQGFMPRLGRRAIVGDARLTCRPLCRFGGDPCPLGTRACMAEIGAGRVLAALGEVRAARTPGVETGAVWS
jgi:heptosyltransferase-2